MDLSYSVRTDPEASKHKGITWVILDMHQPGVQVRPMRTIDGESQVREYLWSWQFTIAAGTSQIQRNLIAERILGMPK